MKTIEDLKQFYNTTLLNDLNVLEEKRKKIAHKLVFIGIALLCVMGVLFFLLHRYIDMVSGPLVLAIVLYIVILLWVSNILSKNYIKEFKIKIISFVGWVTCYPRCFLTTICYNKICVNPCQKIW